MTTESDVANFAAEASHGNDLAIWSARIAAVLFFAATASTMASQMIVEHLQGSTTGSGAQQDLLALAVVLEIVNALASAGIALSLYPVLRHLSELMATGYLGLRVVEGAVGVVAAVGLTLIAVPDQGATTWAAAHHDATFLMVLIVFSCGTFFLYPLLFKYRVVPRFLSLWGIVGGLMLLVSCTLILFSRIEAGGATDLVLSLPIWINEMVLAAWLLFRGFDLSSAGQGSETSNVLALKWPVHP